MKSDLFLCRYLYSILTNSTALTKQISANNPPVLPLYTLTSAQYLLTYPQNE